MKGVAYSCSSALMLTSMLAAAVLLIPAGVYSQTQDWIIRTNHGLPDSTGIARAADMAEGTEASRPGLAESDEGNWTVYNTANSGLPHDPVQALATDARGNIWAATRKGLARFDGVNWTVYTTDNSGLPSDTVWAIVVDERGHKWVGTSGGLAELDGTTWTVYDTTNSGLPVNGVWSLAIDEQGTKWIATLDHNGLVEFDGTNWTVYNTTNSGLPNDLLFSIAIDDQGDKWIATQGGLAQFDGANWTVYRTDNSGLPHDSVWSLAIAQGDKWIGTDRGVARFDDANWTVYDRENSVLPGNSVWSLAIDAQGDKWIGTLGGLAQFDDVNWTVYDRDNSGLPSNDIWALATDTPGNIWIGTTEGMAVYHGEAMSILLPHREGIPLNRSHGIPVSVRNVPEEGILSLDLLLTYDGDVIHPIDISLNGTLTEGWLMAFRVAPGEDQDTLDIGLATAMDPVLTSGTLLAIEAVRAEHAVAGDSTVLHFEHCMYNNNRLRMGLQDGVMYISDFIRPWGDVTNNGQVTAYDAAKILQHAVELITLTGEDALMADVSGRNSITSYDASLILQFVIGKLAQFPVEETQQARRVYAPRTVWMDHTASPGDGRVHLFIQTNEMDGVTAGELMLSFSGNPGDITINMADQTSDYLLAHNIQDGRIRVSFAGAQSGSGAGSLLEIVLDEANADALNSLRLERVSLNEGMIPVRIVREAGAPRVYRLSQNYPNPFNAETTIAYDVAQPGPVRLSVYTLTGQLVRALVDAERQTGSYSVTWDGRDTAGRPVATGVYVCRLEARGHRTTRKTLLVK